METICGQEFGGERPLYKAQDLALKDVVVHAGESALKEVRRIAARGCTFEGKYPFWEADGIEIRGCRFAPGARAAIWYTKHLSMAGTAVEAPKMFRDCEDITLEGCRFSDARETLWHCAGVTLRDVTLEGADYLFMHSRDIVLEHCHHIGNYAFQYCRNITIRHSDIQARDAFWNSENILVEDSTVTSEFLAWYSRGLTLRRCRILGPQPLCYASGLTLEDCTMEDANLAFEYSDVQARLKGAIPSVKNPSSGSIEADAIGEAILNADMKAPGTCRIVSGGRVLH